MTAGAVSLRKSHDIIILSFCNMVKGQAKYGNFFCQAQITDVKNAFLPDLAKIDCQMEKI